MITNFTISKMFDMDKTKRNQDYKQRKTFFLILAVYILSVSNFY